VSPRYALPLIALAALGGCSTLDDIRTPTLTAVGTGVPQGAATPISLPMPAPAQPETYAANSLWRAGARTFFNDQRAGRVGDLLTIKIAIDDSAQVSNSTDRSRKSSSQSGLTNFFGLEKAIGRALPTGAVDPTSLVNGTGDTSMQGSGAVNRQEKIELTMAAMVTQILPNGNLAISGKQEVRVNNELRELTVAGLIRPEDISSENTIRNDQIAEARISYGGRGVVSAVQKPGWGQRVGDALSPW
jgi:flagellar L-ring protein precursor FlgH